MATTEEISERNKQHDDEDDDGCGRDYYSSEGIPVHVLDSGVEIKLPSIPQHYYGVKANGEHCRYPICDEREETIDELPAGVHTGPPGYLREVWDYARKAAYQARAKAAEAALAHTYERELKLQVFFLNQSLEAWKHKALHLMRCTTCFGNSAANTSATASLPSPPATMPPPAAGVTVNPIPELMQANAPIGPSVTPVEAPSSSTPPSPPPPLPLLMGNGADASAAAPLMNGAMSIPNPTTTDAILTTVTSLPELPPPELTGKGKGKGKNSKPPKAKAKGKATKAPTPKKSNNNDRKVGGKRKSTATGGSVDGDLSLGLMWNPPTKQRT